MLCIYMYVCVYNMQHTISTTTQQYKCECAIAIAYLTNPSSMYYLQKSDILNGCVTKYIYNKFHLYIHLSIYMNEYLISTYIILVHMPILCVCSTLIVVIFEISQCEQPMRKLYKQMMYPQYKDMYRMYMFIMCAHAADRRKVRGRAQ